MEREGGKYIIVFSYITCQFYYSFGLIKRLLRARNQQLCDTVSVTNCAGSRLRVAPPGHKLPYPRYLHSVIYCLTNSRRREIALKTNKGCLLTFNRVTG